MTVLDIILLVALALFVIRGVFRGFLLELFDLVSLLAGYLAARFAGPPLGAWFAGVSGIDRWWAGVIAAIVVFLVATAAVRLLARLLRKLARATMLGGLDRFAGAVFGALKAVLLALALYFIAMLTPWAATINSYAMEGFVSRWLALGTTVMRDRIEAGTIEPTRAFAKWLRAFGLDEEIVHVITDQPELFAEILAYAREHELPVPTADIDRGEPALDLPDGIQLSEEQQQQLIGILERNELDAGEKAGRFWENLLGESPSTQ